MRTPLRAIHDALIFVAGVALSLGYFKKAGVILTIIAIIRIYSFISHEYKTATL